MSRNTLTEEGNKFIDSLIADHQRSIWNAAIEAAAKVAYDSNHVWDDKDATLDSVRSQILKLRR